MTEEQYRQVLQGRRQRKAALLFGSVADGRLLRAAAQSVRRRERAWKALGSILQPEWLGVTQVDALERGALVLVVSDRVVCERMRRQAWQLQAQLAQRIPGLERLVITWAG